MSSLVLTLGNDGAWSVALAPGNDPRFREDRLQRMLALVLENDGAWSVALAPGNDPRFREDRFQRMLALVLENEHPPTFSSSQGFRREAE